MPYTPPGRPRRTRWNFGPGLTRAVAWIIGLQVGTYLLYLFLDQHTRAQIETWGVLTGAGLARGHVWKLATTVFLHANPWEFFFDVLMLWLFVPVLEQLWGARRFVWFVALTLLVGNAVSAGVGLLLGGSHRLVPIVGLAPFIYASIAAYGVAYANQPVQLFGIVPIKGKVLAIGTAAFVGLFTIFGQWVAGAGYFAAMGVAVLMGRDLFTPNLWWLRWRRWKIKRRYQVIDGGAGTRRDRGKKQWLN